MNTYWVTFSWTYLIWTGNEWEEVNDCDGRRFRCHKKEIKHQVEEYVKNELMYEKYRNLKLIIEDYYITSDVEL